MDALGRDFAGLVNVGKLNVDENPEISVRYGVTNLPCILFMYKGQVVDRMVGAAAKPVYEKKVRQLLEKLQ
jgi:thioredoxin 1